MCDEAVIVVGGRVCAVLGEVGREFFRHALEVAAPPRRGPEHGHEVNLGCISGRKGKEGRKGRKEGKEGKEGRKEGKGGRG